ncbi:unnamed protein product [Alternaria alternata]
MLATPEEIEKQIPELIKLRAQYGITERPFVVWKPFPASCTRQNRHAYLQACRHVDVFSPNHLEISALFEDTSPKGFQPDQLEAYALEFCKGTGVSGNGIVVIQYDECLRAILISDARVVYGPGFPAGSVFDVTNSPGVINITSIVSHVIIYPTTKLFSADGVVSGKFVEVMRSTEFLYIRQTYWSLMNLLRPKILKAIRM